MGRVSLQLTSPKSVLFTFPFAVREVRFHPIYILLQRDFAVAAFVTLGDRLIAPLVKFVLFQLMNPHTGGIALVVFVVDWNRLIVGDFRLVVLQRGKLLAHRLSALSGECCLPSHHTHCNDYTFLFLTCQNKVPREKFLYF